MANYIHVTPEKLTTTANEFQRIAGQVKSTTAQMTNIVSSLKGATWYGEAQKAYAAKFNGLNDDINKMYQMITQQVTHLKQIASTYKSTESTNMAQAGSLSSDLIS